MKVLVVAPQPFFAARGTPLSVYYRTLVMAELGVSIDLLTYGLGDDINLAGVRHVRIPRLPFIRSIPVGPSLRKLAHDFLMLVWTFVLCVRHRYVAVHAHEEAVFWCALFKKVFGYKLIYDMHSSLPQQLDNFQKSKYRWFKPIFSWLERWSIESTDLLVTICPDLEMQVSRQYSSKTPQILIENSLFDPVVLKKPQTSEVKDDFLDPLKTSRRWIYYGGTFECYQGVEILVDAMPTVLTVHPEAGLLLAGGSSKQVAAIAERVAALNIGHAVSLTGTVPRTYAKCYLDLCSVVVSPRTRGSNTPMKIYEQLASGKPLVSTRIWSHTQVLNDEICFLVDPTPHSMADGLIAALGNHEAVQSKTLAAQRFYQQRYSRDAYKDKVRQVIARVS